MVADARSAWMAGIVAAGVALVALAGLPTATAAATKATRPCREQDWRYDFSKCHATELFNGAGNVREAFAYAPPEVCDPGAEGSKMLPQPVISLPCEEPCEAGSRLAVWPAHQNGKSRKQERAKLKVDCVPCLPGTFSLGGGTFVDGVAGDWAKPWPAGFSTICLYRTADFSWRVGGDGRLACVLHLTHGPNQPALKVETRAGTWNQNLPDAELQAPFKVVEGLACNPINGTAANGIRGAVVLILRGTCTFVLKTEQLASAGAVAVIVYNNLYRMPHFYPAAPTNSTLPAIPIFMVTREDGERLKAAAAVAELQGHVPQLTISSTHCSLDRQEWAPVVNQSSGVNLSANGNDSWDTQVERGCAHWAADPAGGFIHSGNNHGFHWLYSFLTLSVRFVRDGYIRFRYAVDAEKNYDGLVFEIDGEPVWMEAVKSVVPMQDFKVNVSRGPHSFTWAYKKDYGNSHGEDRARLQVLEVSGTAHADYECRGCSSVSHSSAGHCQTCGRNKYGHIDTIGQTSCRPCPPNHWSPPGSIGEASCKVKRQCNQHDVEILYALPNSGTSKIPGIFCYNNKTTAHVEWRRPITCDTQKANLLALASMTTRLQERPCPPCQPLQWRPSGAECVNRPARSCRSPTYAMARLIVNQWHVWPVNFTSWIWGDSSREDQSHSWQLASDGRAVVVGNAFVGGGGAEIESILKARADQAILLLNVTLATSGLLEFFVEERPREAWKKAGAVYVDHDPATPDSETVVDGIRRVVVSIEAGWHYVTWVWRYQGLEGHEESADSSGFDGGSGLRLLNISVTNVEGASRSGVCQRCAEGQGLVDSTAVCRPCPAGRSSADHAAGGQQSSDSRCHLCPAGRASGGRDSVGAASCEPCGPGLRSAEGAQFCEPTETLGSASADSPQWSSKSLVEAWQGQFSPALDGLRSVQVEDRTYYVNLFQPGKLTEISNGILGVYAYWWELLPPREASDGSTCLMQDGSFVRPVGEVLEAIKPSEDGAAPGLWLTFSGDCESGASGRRWRRAHLFLRCDPEQPADIADVAFISNLRPSSRSSCEDVAVEWRTQAACPVCRALDWQPISEGTCHPTKGQMVTFVTTRWQGCIGGAPKPADYWEPCPGVVSMLAFTVLAALIGCVLCCLSCYVMLLRRRYARYMVLGETQAGKANGVAPENIGAPDSAA